MGPSLVLSRGLWRQAGREWRSPTRSSLREVGGERREGRGGGRSGGREGLREEMITSGPNQQQVWQARSRGRGHRPSRGVASGDPVLIQN